MGTFGSFFDRYLPSIEREMRQVLQAFDSGQGDLFGFLRYHLGWVDAAFRPCHARSGKRIRPVLCLLACEGCGGNWEKALPAAAAIELLHNFSLIHDDIEDQDEMRRGRRTVWSIWGQAQGINAGDALFSISQLAILRLRQRDVPPAVVLDAAQLFNETCVALTTGQHLDIDFESRDRISVDQYVVMIEGKTAALVAATCELGSLIAGTNAATRSCLHAFGYHAGLAFQMQDDVLGIWGDPTVTGKPVGSDIARGKKTLPVLHGLEQSAELRSLLARGSLSQTNVRQATELLEQVGSRDYVDELARQHYQLALRALAEASLQEPAAQALRQLAHRLLIRRR
jgi:geranylgeranyl diphosphate synthase type I